MSRIAEKKDFEQRLAALLAHFRAQRIALKELPLETEHEGVALRGRIYYWAKDWFAVLEEPVPAFGPTGHLPMAAPARFVAKGERVGEGNIGRELPGAEMLVEIWVLNRP